ncbi:glycosyltransferase family 2 protein [Xanthomarina gelatinilytica]|uniref:glycosyltransferase family 2 protein n=1 Tax=Xanthomarina gelatinilytica TaxID=1137281 RepID=UPI003AA80B67
MLISIITINYNHLAGLKKTMQSVLEQTYSKIEYIIIDGGSTDGSKEYIESKDKNLAYWVSEADQGIYHAMNKGIDQATGEYLLFLNSGDWLVDKLVVERFVNFKPTEDIVYGDPLVREGNTWKRKFMPKEMSVGVALTHTLSHQAEFYKRSLFNDNFRYNTSYKVVSDWILTNNAIIFKNASTRYIDLVVCYFENPGISSDFNFRHAERNSYLKDHFDPVFLKLLKEYKRLNKTHTLLINNKLIKAVLWLLKKKTSLFQLFKK